ncbi:hypothetical protein BE15_10540 [Sorangium cellulosum]|uniref:Uncharacterized protein n=1 Tax=Sorangium cellulosum TaxID=56 RepID=A0A150QKE1_SORCE|nr:hypothetical protein BE15_10540 [Sorangium cellulosum]
MDPALAQPARPGLGEFAPAHPSSRAVLVASLAETLARAVTLGDEEAARILHEAVGRLLGLSAGPEGRARSRP